MLHVCDLGSAVGFRIPWCDSCYTCIRSAICLHVVLCVCNMLFCSAVSMFCHWFWPWWWWEMHKRSSIKTTEGCFSQGVATRGTKVREKEQRMGFDKWSRATPARAMHAAVETEQDIVAIHKIKTFLMSKKTTGDVKSNILAQDSNMLIEYQVTTMSLFYLSKHSLFPFRRTWNNRTFRVKMANL